MSQVTDQERITEFQEESPLSKARRMARYSHKDWIVWVDASGKRVCARKTPESVKQCLLDRGTQGRWILVEASTASLHQGDWWTGCNIIRQMKAGHQDY